MTWHFVCAYARTERQTKRGDIYASTHSARDGLEMHVCTHIEPKGGWGRGDHVMHDGCSAWDHGPSHLYHAPGGRGVGGYPRISGCLKFTSCQHLRSRKNPVPS